MEIERKYKITLTEDEFNLLSESMEELSDIYIENLKSLNHKDKNYHNDEKRAFQMKKLSDALKIYNED